MSLKINLIQTVWLIAIASLKHGVVMTQITEDNVRATLPLGTLIFADEFNTFNKSIWQPMITVWRGGNNEFEWYTDTPNNSYVANGVLHIAPTLTSDHYGEAFLYNGTLDLRTLNCYSTGVASDCYRQGLLNGDIINPIQSARLRTIKSFGFTYGRVEIRAKMPRGDWIWPAAWLLPVNNLYGGWPRSGEIDMVEVRGNDNYVCNGGQVGNKRAAASLHWGTSPNTDQYRKTTYPSSLSGNQTYSNGYHIYGLQWLPTGISFTIDNVTIGSITANSTRGFWNFGGFSNGTNIWINGTTLAPFDKNFYLLLNVAVGGNFFPDGCKNYDSTGRLVAKPWITTSTSTINTQMLNFWKRKADWYPTWTRNPGDSHMLVDYVRVYSV